MARAIGKTRIAQAGHDRRASDQTPRNNNTTGRTTPAHGQTGATRFSGVTKISSRIPAAAASRASVDRQRPDRQEGEIPEEIHASCTG